MADYLKLKNAPITEALIDIQVALPSEVQLSTLLSLREIIKESYPEYKARQTGLFELRADETGLPEVITNFSGTEGYFFLTNDKTKVLQARLNGFTFSKIKPYDTWEMLKDEAQYYWELYRRIAKPTSVNRLAVRFVNSIGLPNNADFKEYFYTTPEIAPGLPQGLPQYQMNLFIPFREKDVIALVKQTVDIGSMTEDKIPIIFDIDVFKSTEIDPNSEEIWQILEDLRQIKNDIFFKSLTAKTLELFN